MLSRSVIAGLCLSLFAPAWSPLALAEAKKPDAAVPDKGWDAVETLFAKPSMAQMALSPDGTHMAVLVPVNDRRNLAVINLDTRQLKVLTNLKGIDVARFFWVNNQRLIFTQGDANAGSGQAMSWGGVVAVNRDGSDLKRFKLEQRLVSTLAGEGNAVLMSSRERSAKTLDLYRVDTLTGKSTLLTYDNPGQIEGYVADLNGAPKVAISVDGKHVMPKYQVLYREAEGKDWQLLKAFEDGETGAWEPLGIDADGRTLFVAIRAAHGRMVLHTYDLISKSLEGPIIDHELVDVDAANADLMRDAKGKVVGLSLMAEKPELYWFDRAWSKLSEQVDGALPGRINALRGDAGGRLAVYSLSDRDPGGYYLLDARSMKLEEVAQAAPWIDTARMSSMEPIRYTARDGMTIPAYLTLPQGKPRKNLPLIVNVHGGPFGVRDEWGWRPEVQFLASRGYAVLQPNYRGSGGFGWKHHRAGWKQWGLSMQDDVTDGVLHLIKQGIVDKDRVCIYGGSYGGYAVLMGVVKDPDLYRCGVDIVGVSDIAMKFDVQWSDYASSDYVKYGRMAAMVGDPGKDRAQLDATSPIRHADKIKAPLLIAHGALDRRVPIVHAERMRDALKAQDKPYEWLVIDDEGHGFGKMDNVKLFYPRVEAFLAKHLGQSIK